MRSCAKRKFFFFLSNLNDLYFFFPCLETLAITPSPMLNRNCGSTHFCFISDLREKGVFHYKYYVNF